MTTLLTISAREWISNLKAVLYNLMLAGSVIVVPDSIWTSDFWAGMLISAALRGCRVYVVAPAHEQAPSNAAPTLELIAIPAGIGRHDAVRFAEVAILRDGHEVVFSKSIDEPGEVRLVWTDPAPEAVRTHSYFVRLVQDDHHRAWSSPIWWTRPE